MPRTTSAAVGAVIELDDAIDITPFIETANALVTEVCVPSGYDDTRLELIERWLSAHFYAIRDPRAVSESVKGLGVTYQSAVGLALMVTHYGQHAAMLDTKGGLAKLSMNTAQGRKPFKAGIAYLGPTCP